jgi:hypothetical protein
VCGIWIFGFCGGIGVLSFPFWDFVVKYRCGKLSEANFAVRYRWGMAEGQQEFFVTFGTLLNHILSHIMHIMAC